MKFEVLNLFKALSNRKRGVLIVAIWGLVLGLIVIKVYWVGYQEIEWLQYYRVPWGGYETPNPNILDLLLVLIAGIVVGILISNVKALFYGFIGSLLFAFMIGFTFVMFYMWAVLKVEHLFSWADFNWEWAVLIAIFNVGKIMFPQMIFLSLLGVVIGAFLRERIGY